MDIHPTKNYNVDCYVDADFGGLWGSEDEQDPIYVKSQTGVFIIFMGYPLLCISKLQHQIALSTTKVEYIDLSHSMRELIGVREILKEIYSNILDDSHLGPKYRTIHKYGCSRSIPQSKVY